MSNNVYRIKKRTPKRRKRKLTEGEKFLNKMFNKKNWDYNWGKPKLCQTVVKKHKGGKIDILYSFRGEYYLHEFFCLTALKREGVLLPEKTGMYNFAREDITTLLHLVVANFERLDMYPTMIFDNVKNLSSKFSSIGITPNREDLIDMLTIVKGEYDDHSIMYCYGVV